MNFCGIDFGTSNSAVAVVTPEGVRLARIEDDSTVIPSAIFYYTDGTPVYGQEAVKSFFLNDDGRFIRSFKRTLGTDLVEFGAIINGKLKRYDHIIAGFIRQLKNRAEKDIDASIDNVVIGRPVHFVDRDESADRLAQSQLESMARLVGFKNVEFQFEPVAAAFAHERYITGERLALIIDIGGGTSDFSVIRLSSEHRNRPDRKDDILSNAGIRLGGNDFDKEFCLSSFMPLFGYKSSYGDKNLPAPTGPFHDMSEWSKVNQLYVPRTLKILREVLLHSHDPQRFSRFARIVETEAGYKVLSAVEESKIKLSSEIEFLVDLDFAEQGLSAKITRENLDEISSSLIGHILHSIDMCLESAGVKNEDIQLIILTGGTTEILSLQNKIKMKFPYAEVSQENKLSSVSYGLGYDSIRRFGAANL